MTPAERAALILKIRRKQDPCLQMPLTPTQQRANNCKARYIAVRGSNRCLGGEQEIYDPVLNRYCRVDSITSDFHVLAWNGKHLVATEAKRPFIKPAGPIYRYVFSDGSFLVASSTHVVLLADGTWQPLSQCQVGYAFYRPQSTLVLTSLEYLRDDVKWDFEVPGLNNYYAGGVINHNSGKTAWSAKKLATIARQLPDVKTTSVTGVYIVFAPSREQIQSPWAKKLLEGSELPGDLYERPFIPDYEIEHISYTYGAGDPTVKAITLKNGNKIIFCVSGDKNVWKRLEGKALLGAVLDESAGTEKLLTELMARLLDANSHPVVQQEAGGAWIIWGATQTKKSPAFEQFLSICQSDAPEHGDYAAFTLVADENPSVSMEERQKLAVMMSEDEYKIRMEGHGSAASAMAVYPQWNDERNLVDGPDYIPGPEDNLWWFFDPGAHYAGIVLAAINKEHPHRLNVFKCMQPQRATLEQCVKMVRDELGGRALEGVVYDQAARKKEMSGRSAISEMAQILTRKGYDIKIHRGLMMGRSNYKDTVPLVREYLCTPPSYPDHPTKVILNRSPESGCQLLRWQIMNVAFKENDYELKEENISKGNDHLSDSLRYGISRKPSYVYRGNNPKLWGEGTHGQDPDGDVDRFYKSTSGDIHTDHKTEVPQTPGQRFALRRAKRLKQQRQAKRRW